MPLFRKKVKDVEAEQYFNGRLTKGVLFADANGWLHFEGKSFGGYNEGEDRLPICAGQAFVITIHGAPCPVVDGDWILPEPDGKHYYPVKEDIFESSYDLVKP